MTEGEFLGGDNSRKWNYMVNNNKSKTKAGSSEPSHTTAPGHLTPEREAEIRKNLGDLIESELDYPVLWQLPSGERVLI